VKSTGSASGGEQLERFALDAPRAAGDVSPAADDVTIDYQVASHPPAFRFMFGARGGAVVPYGCLTRYGLVRRLQEPWFGAAGDVLALDSERLVASFARVEASNRAQAEDHLRSWAEADDWSLHIELELAPLRDTKPWTATIGRREPSCPSCGAVWPLARERAAFPRRRFVTTRCHECNQGRIAPYGLVRCATCQEARGWVIEVDFGEVELLGAACICDGIACLYCDKGLVRRPISNHFDEQSGTVWHTPYVSGLAHCGECREFDNRRAIQ
jgi:hypothetical protein